MTGHNLRPRRKSTNRASSTTFGTRAAFRISALESENPRDRLLSSGLRLANGCAVQASSLRTQSMRFGAACLTSPWGVLGSRPFTGRVSGGRSLSRNPSCRKEADRRYRQEVDSRRRQSNDSPYLADPRSINLLLRPARSPATQSRQARNSTPFPPARASTPTRTGAETICCTGNVVRKLRGSRDTQQGACLLP
jgi:hypothetical protein